MNWVFFTLAWSTFYLLHSLLAGEKAKDWVKKNISNAYTYYRLGYNLFFIITMGLLVYWTIVADAGYLFPRKTWMIIAGGILTFWGTILLMLAGKNYNLREFAGIPSTTGHAGQPTKEKLIITGLNKWVRHPLYLSIYILFTGIALLHPAAHTWVAIGISFIYLPIGIYSEEKKLIATFGEEYKKYRKSTPAIFPFLRW